MERFISKLIYGLIALIFLMVIFLFTRLGRSDVWVALSFVFLSGVWFSLSYLHVLKQNMQQARNYLLFGFATVFLSLLLLLFIVR